MPKVYLTQEDRDKAAAERHRKKMIAAIYGRMRAEKITTTDLGKVLGCTQQGAAYRVRNGILSVMDLWKMQELIPFSDSEIIDLVRGDRAINESGRSDALRKPLPPNH